jgi:hypothetical protein
LRTIPNLAGTLFVALDTLVNFIQRSLVSLSLSNTRKKYLSFPGLSLKDWLQGFTLRATARF